MDLEDLFKKDDPELWWKGFSDEEKYLVREFYIKLRIKIKEEVDSFYEFMIFEKENFEIRDELENILGDFINNKSFFDAYMKYECYLAEESVLPKLGYEKVEETGGKEWVKKK